MIGKSKHLQLGLTARKLHGPARWLRSQVELGHLPCLRAGKRLLFNSQAVEDVLPRCAAGNDVEDMTNE